MVGVPFNLAYKIILQGMKFSFAQPWLYGKASKSKCKKLTKSLKNDSASVNKENFYRRIIPADSADEFYCIMGQLSQEMLEYKIEDTNRLIKVHN